MGARGRGPVAWTIEITEALAEKRPPKPTKYGRSSVDKLPLCPSHRTQAPAFVRLCGVARATYLRLLVANQCSHPSGPGAGGCVPGPLPFNELLSYGKDEVGLS
jgi:hypothetical protein